MELKDWVLKHVEEFGGLLIYRSNSMKEDVSWFTLEKYSYEEIVETYGEDTFFSCYVTRGDFRYFICWDHGKGYVFKINFVINIPQELFFYSSVFGQGEGWKSILLKKYPKILTECKGCKCYNDKLTGEWCTDKELGISVWS